MAAGVSPSHHGRRFRLAYLLLALVVAGVVAVFVIVETDSSTTTRTASASGETWGTFEPAGLTSDRIQQIALHVGSTYRTPGGRQLVSVSASIPPAYQNDMKITQYVLSYKDGGQTSYQAVPIGANNVLYELCGLGPRCAIDSGKATPERGRLLRREALELTLYTFHYTGVGSVVTFLPPKRRHHRTGPVSLPLHIGSAGRRAARVRPSGGAVAGMTPQTRAALERARARLDTLDLYPRPVRLAPVRVITAPLLFRLPWFRSFDGYATHLAIFLRRPVTGQEQDDLVTHELCHVWQMQHRPLAMPVSYFVRGYQRNPYEAEARRATEQTRGNPLRPEPGSA